MPLTAQSIPALYGGVSQQAAISRSPTQCEDALNVDFSVARGASKRPPLELVTQLSASDESSTFFTWVRTQFGLWFLVAVPGDGSYTVYDVETGNQITCANASGQSYLTTSGNASEDFFAVSIDNKLYIVNRTVQTVLDAAAAEGTLAGSAQTLQDPDLDSAPNDSIYEIVGSEDNPNDSYYVKKSGGKWYEWIKPGIQYQIDASTMPHAITISWSGSASADFAAETWADRRVGDVDSNKAPSFLGRPIHSLFFASDRLGIISGQSFTCSRVDDYTNFWRTTVTDVLDDDRIDEKANAFEASKLFFGESVSRSLIMFAEERQFAVDGKPVFSPNSLSVTPITTYPTAPYARPVSAGANVYFTSDVGGFSHVREMYIQDETLTMGAANVTAHVPEYVPANIRTLETHSNMDHVLLASPDDPGYLYSYQFYWKNDTEKAMSAWNRWQIAADCTVLSLRTIGPYVYAVYAHPTSSSTFLGRFNLKYGDWTDGFPYKVHLDHLQKVSPVYNSSENRTYFNTAFPMVDSAGDNVVHLVRGAGWDNVGSYEARDVVTPFVRMTDTQFYLVGDWTDGSNEWWVGLPYDFRYTFSEQFYEENGRAQLHTRVQIRSMTVHFDDTGYFQVEVKARGHDLVTEEIVPELATTYTSRTVGDEYFRLNQPHLISGTHQFPVLNRASDVTLTLINESPLPCSFQSAEWKGLVSKRTPR